MYIILLDKDNALTVTNKECIMQRSKMVDKLCFLVEPQYKGADMKNSTVLLEYISPISKQYHTEILELTNLNYKGYLQYVLPFDTELTSEPGKIEVQLSFFSMGLEDGKVVEKVRKTIGTKIEITPISPWSDYVPDSALSSIDQRILKQDAQIMAMEELANNLKMLKADDMEYNDLENTLQLLSDNTPIGTKVKLKTPNVNELLEDGVPIVMLDGDVTPDDDICDDDEDNVVEF